MRTVYPLPVLEVVATVHLWAIDRNRNRLTGVTTGPVDWKDIKATSESATARMPELRLNNGPAIPLPSSISPITRSAQAGDVLSLATKPEGELRLSLAHAPSNALLGTWEFGPN